MYMELTMQTKLIGTQRSTLFWLLSPGIKGVTHNDQHSPFFLALSVIPLSSSSPCFPLSPFFALPLLFNYVLYPFSHYPCSLSTFPLSPHSGFVPPLPYSLYPLLFWTFCSPPACCNVWKSIIIPSPVNFPERWTESLHSL